MMEINQLEALPTLANESSIAFAAARVVWLLQHRLLVLDAHESDIEACLDVFDRLKEALGKAGWSCAHVS